MFEDLKNAIALIIKQNDAGEITGELMQQVLFNIIDITGLNVVSKFSDGTVEHIIIKTKEEWELMTDGDKDPKTVYLVLDPDQSEIAQMLLDLQTQINEKADVQSVNESLNQLSEALALKANSEDLLSISTSLSYILSSSFGSIHPAAEEKPAEGVSRRYRFTFDGNCSFTGVKNELTEDVLEVPFPVKKDDELQVVFLSGAYTYRYYPIATKEATARYNADQEIIASIDNLSGEIGSESLARTAGDNALQASIENLSGEVGSESLARTAGDNALQASIGNLSGEIGSESLARTAGDNALQASIGSIDTVLGILTGDVSGDIDLIINEMQGV